MVGRWLNADNVIAGVGSAQGYNMFAYCWNNPVNASDYSGSWPSGKMLELAYDNFKNYVSQKWNDLKEWGATTFSGVADGFDKVVKSAGAIFQGINASVSTGGLGGSVNVANVADISLLAKADIQQISVSGFDGFDFGKEVVAKLSGGIGPFWNSN